MGYYISLLLIVAALFCIAGTTLITLGSIKNKDLYWKIGIAAFAVSIILVLITLYLCYKAITIVERDNRRRELRVDVGNIEFVERARGVVAGLSPISDPITHTRNVMRQVSLERDNLHRSAEYYPASREDEYNRL